MSAKKSKDTKIWISRPFDPDRVGRLAKAAGLSSLVAQLFYARGITNPAEVKTFSMLNNFVSKISFMLTFEKSVSINLACG